MLVEETHELIRLFASYSAGTWYWLLYALSLFLLFLAGTSWRRAVVYPTLLGAAVLLNPLTFAFFWQKVSYSNWRIFWILPVTGTIAAAAAALLGRIRKTPCRAAAGALLLAVLAVCGKSVYSTDGTGFTEASNPYKLPAEVLAVGNDLLAREEEPMAVVSSGLFCYLRQYSSDIHMLYGRDATGHSIHRIDEDRLRVYEMLDEEHPDMKAVRQEMEKFGCRYLVLWDNGKFDENAMRADGFEKLSAAGIYSIYRVVQ